MSTKQALLDATTGAISSLFAMLAFYPIDVLKTNLQADKCVTNDSEKFFSSLFRGVYYKTAHTVASSFTYFFIFSWLQWKHRRLSACEKERGEVRKYQPSARTRLLLAAVAGIVNVVFTLPLDVLTANSQINSKEFQSETGTDTMDDESSEGAEGGNTLMDHIWNGIHQAEERKEKIEIYYTAREDISDTVERNGAQFRHSVKDTDMIRIDEELQPDNISNRSRLNNNIKDQTKSYFDQLEFVFLKQNNHTNIREFSKFTDLWRGIWPSILLCSNPSIHFTVYDTLKDTVLTYKSRIANDLDDRDVDLSLKEAFALGIVAKLVATIITYPLIRAKTVLMVASKCDYESQNKNTINGILRGMIREGGVGEMYRGFCLQLFHTVLKSALMMMARERINLLTRRLMEDSP